MRKFAFALAAFSLAVTASAHVTPNVTLVKRGDFVKQALPGASQFFEQSVDGAAVLAAVRAATGWTPRPKKRRSTWAAMPRERRSVASSFCRIASEHQTVGVAVSFGPDGRIRQAAVTDVGTEPLVWVRPLVDGLAGLSGLALDAAPDPERIAPAVKGKMSRYYAEVIAEAVKRAQAVERALLAVPRS